MTYCIQLKNVSKRRGSFSFGPVELNIPTGYVTGIIGPNGAGKTTLLEICAGMMQPDEGSLHVFGEEIRNKPSSWKHEIGYVGPYINFHGEFKVKEAVLWLQSIYTTSNDSWINELYKRLKINPHQKINTLSKGQLAKVNLLLGIAHQPNLMLLDEVTAGVDPIVRLSILDILREEMLDEHKTIVMSSHITSDIEELADYIMFIIDGKVILHDEKEQLIEDWRVVTFSDNSVAELNDASLQSAVGFHVHKGVPKALIHQTQWNDDNFRKTYGGQLKKPSLDELLRFFEQEVMRHDETFNG